MIDNLLIVMLYNINKRGCPKSQQTVITHFIRERSSLEKGNFIINCTTMCEEIPN